MNRRADPEKFEKIRPAGSVCGTEGFYVSGIRAGSSA